MTVKVEIEQVMNGWVVTGHGGGRTIFLTLADVLADLPHYFPTLGPVERLRPVTDYVADEVAAALDGPDQRATGVAEARAALRGGAEPVCINPWHVRTAAHDHSGGCYTIADDGHGHALRTVHRPAVVDRRWTWTTPYNPDAVACAFAQDWPHAPQHNWRCIIAPGHDGAHEGPDGQRHVDLEDVVGGEGREWQLGPPWDIRVRLIHCDPLVLHAPGVCSYCDAYGTLDQQVRAARNIAFTSPSGVVTCQHGIPTAQDPRFPRFLAVTTPTHVMPCRVTAIVSASRTSRGGGIIIDPAEANRPGGVSQEWGGNRPATRPAEVGEFTPQPLGGLGGVDA